jgi:hypothetical protein
MEIKSTQVSAVIILYASSAPQQMRTFFFESNLHETSLGRLFAPPPPHCPLEVIQDAPVASSPRYNSAERFSIAREARRDVNVKSSLPMCIVASLVNLWSVQGIKKAGKKQTYLQIH